MTDPIKVDIWSDVQCPWCYIGKRKFEAGAKLYGKPVEVEYHSFELAPDTPVDYEGDPVQYLSERKGIPVEQVHQMLERVTGIAESVGLHYNYDAGEIGLDEQDVLRSLETEEYLPSVKADMAQAREYGITGVPFYVIDGKYGISGAQDAATFAAALIEAAENRA